MRLLGRTQLAKTQVRGLRSSIARPKNDNRGAKAAANDSRNKGHPDLILWSAWDCIHLGGRLPTHLHGGLRERSERSYQQFSGAAPRPARKLPTGPPWETVNPRPRHTHTYIWEVGHPMQTTKSCRGGPGGGRCAVERARGAWQTK